MISRNKDNFVVSHYDWIVAGVAALALVAAAVYFVLSLGNDAEAAAKEAVAAIDRQKPSECGVEKTDLSPFATVLRQAKSPTLIAEIDGARESAFASERRVKCRCGQVLPAGLAECPSCKASLVVVNKEDEAAKKAERWKGRYGVDPDGTDKDGDGFTNQEEFAAGTDPTDAKDHPPYFDSLKLTLPLKETYVPFALVKATKIPVGWRCEFLDPKRKDDYGRMGRTFTAVVGEEIVVPVTTKGVTKNEPTGFILKGFEPKEESRALTAGSTMTKSVDVSVATVARKGDGKSVGLVVQPGQKKVRLTPIDVQATLVYERMETKNFEVVTGDVIDLNGTKCEIVSVKPVGKGAEVVLKDTASRKQKTLKALE